MSHKIAIVMPAYNEADVISEVVLKWTELLQNGFKSEDNPLLIIVNDGSKDNTFEILTELAKNNKILVPVNQPNGGHGNAVVNAYKKAIEMQAEYVFQTDSDDQFETQDFFKLWEKRNESNFILGYRKQRFDAPIRLVITRILKFSVYLFFGVFIEDSNIPFRLVKGDFLKKMLSKLPEPVPFAPNIFLSVMAKKSGNKIFSIPITHKDRHTGEVSIRKMKLLKVCWKSFNELLAFRRNLPEIVKSLKTHN
ncbi:MAG: glycosyltransferase family 2 protein [Bacteroidetes bacterium]|nr:glycosyltransferase family 2 protein [Bacteroidota bacterium]